MDLLYKVIFLAFSLGVGVQIDTVDRQSCPSLIHSRCPAYVDYSSGRSGLSGWEFAKPRDLCEIFHPQAAGGTEHHCMVTSPAGAVAKYCDEHVCLSVRQDISGTARAIFTSFSVYVARGRSSVLLR